MSDIEVTIREMEIDGDPILAYYAGRLRESLRQVPEAKPLADRLPRESECTAEAAHHFYAQGWNACRDAIANHAQPTSVERRFRGVGELERSGYIPEGSADEREATPAQALGDIGHWLCKYSDDGRYMNLNGPSSRQCFEVGQKLIKHGQHFAGLEADLSKAYEIAASHADRADAAEARCAELEERNEYLANELQLARSHVTGWKLRCQQWQEQAESDRASAREAEGLLRHWQAWICGPSELHKATATFLAASGETKLTRKNTPTKQRCSDS